MPGNPLVRFDEGRVGRTERCRPLSYSTPGGTSNRADDKKRSSAPRSAVSSNARARFQIVAYC